MVTQIAYFMKDNHLFKKNSEKISCCTFLHMSVMFGLAEDSQILLPASAFNLL